MRIRSPRSVSIAVLATLPLAAAWTLSAQVAPFKPVTDAMLIKPDPADWINWRRTLDGWGYSPLNQINRQNVHQLQLVWSWGLPSAGRPEPNPLVYAGVMYIPSPFGVVEAVDAVTGELKWQYRQNLGSAKPRSIVTTRNIAIYDDKIYLTTMDARVIALNARTGKEAWNVQAGDPARGFTYTAGPIVVAGKVISSVNGCEQFKPDPCFIVAHDAGTGKEVWRRSTIARPGEPGGDTWGDTPMMFRAGGDAWTAGSYDAQTNLIYWATAQPKPWTRAQRGHDGDALYTNSVLALDPATGKIVWYNQLLPGETHDMDEVFENLLVDHSGRRSLFKMGKLGILWQLDRTTGKFLSAYDLGYQTLVDVHPVTGKVTYRPGMIPREGVELEFCPSVAGFKSWRAMAYHPDTRAFYFPLNVSCEKATFGAGPARVEGGGGVGTSTARRHRRAHFNGRRRKDSVAASHAHRHRQRRADDRRRSGRRGGLGSFPLRARCGDRKDSLSDAVAQLGDRIPNHLFSRGPTVSGDSRGQRCVDVEQHLGGLHAGKGPARAWRLRHVRLRAS
jgi:alcohol dehydrogenase (cytochrome c)